MAIINKQEFERELIKDIGSFTYDPLKYVLYAFPWGKKDSPLEEFSGPDEWQREVLKYVGERLRTGASTKGADLSWVIQVAISSGHGIGKTALVCMLLLWAISTIPDCKGIVTANTATQLSTKTWAELAKWHSMCINKHWFDLTATSIFCTEKGHEKTWRIDAIPWSKEKSEAFAGLHNKRRRILIIFDEASAIPPIIWEVTEGALSDEETEILWFAFGNPTRTDGRFYDCFHKQRQYWKHWKIDSRTASMTNKALLNSMVERYGEDSDIVKVRIRGEFPSASVSQFIPTDLVDAAKSRTITADEIAGAPVILGLDVARYGDDASVLWLRQRLYCKRVFKVSRVDTMQLASMMVNSINAEKANAAFIDISGGLGAGVYDRLKQLNYGHICIPVNFGSAASKPARYANKRCEMYGEAKEWLMDGGALPPTGEESEELCEDLAAVDYFIDRNGRTALEEKADVKEKLGRSPDDGDGFVLTFAAPVAAANALTQMYGSNYDTANNKYDMFAL